MDPIWEKLHSSRAWGKYPSDDLIRTVMRTFKKANLGNLKVLEVGFGGGANLSFFVNEGFQIYGIDGAPSAVRNARSHLEGVVQEDQTFELIAQDFTQLPWPSEFFDIVVDYLAIYANRMTAIDKAFAECYRVLKPGGHLYSRSWAQGCSGFDTGKIIEPGTSENPTSGPCAGMGTSHFFSKSEIEALTQAYAHTRLRLSSIIDEEADERIIEWLVWAQK